MTTFAIDGPITSIVTEADYDISSHTGGTAISPTVINPSGARRTIILASESAGGNNQFQLSSTFNIGDIVEVYNDSPTTQGMGLLDENSHDITCASLATPGQANALTGTVYVKIRSGAGRNWGHARFA